MHYTYAQFIDPHYDGIQIQINNSFLFRINNSLPCRDLNPGPSECQADDLPMRHRACFVYLKSKTYLLNYPQNLGSVYFVVKTTLSAEFEKSAESLKIIIRPTTYSFKSPEVQKLTFHSKSTVIIRVE